MTDDWQPRPPLFPSEWLSESPWPEKRKTPIEKLQEENARLREALKPFAEIPITAPEGREWWQAAVSLHSSDLRRARAALGKTGG